MLMKTRLSGISLALTLGTGLGAQAASFQFALPDLASFETHDSQDTSLTFRGTGFVGMIDDRWGSGEKRWAHLLGLETDSLSRTLMQLELAPLVGQKVVSATLRFNILDGDEQGTNSIVVQGFNGGAGDLALSWERPHHAHGASVGTASAGSAASIDITQQLQYSVDNGHDWLGLHLQAVGTKYLYTATHDYPSILSPDRAGVRIDVITTAVPEPESWALMLGGAGLLGWAKRRRHTGT